MNRTRAASVPLYKTQLLPLFATIITAGILALFLSMEVRFLNRFTIHDLATKIVWPDILIGLTIYLKTSVDFAIFIGNVMASYSSWKHRVAIEVGTSVGNAVGTMLILALWDFFKDIKILLALMILLAALVLLKLAEESLAHIQNQQEGSRLRLTAVSRTLEKILQPINNFFHGGLKYIIPNLSMKPKKNLAFWGLLSLSFTIPFILGLDDFAGYVPVFNIVNVLGFSIGVILGHMFLCIFLFLSPNTTIKVVQNAIVSVAGSVAFIALALWGFYEVFKLLFLH